MGVCRALAIQLIGCAITFGIDARIHPSSAQYTVQPSTTTVPTAPVPMIERQTMRPPAVDPPTPAARLRAFDQRNPTVQPPAADLPNLTVRAPTTDQPSPDQPRAQP